MAADDDLSPGAWVIAGPNDALAARFNLPHYGLEAISAIYQSYFNCRMTIIIDTGESIDHGTLDQEFSYLLMPLLIMHRHFGPR